MSFVFSFVNEYNYTWKFKCLWDRFSNVLGKNFYLSVGKSDKSTVFKCYSMHGKLINIFKDKKNLLVIRKVEKPFVIKIGFKWSPGFEPGTLWT